MKSKEKVSEKWPKSGRKVNLEYHYRTVGVKVHKVQLPRIVTMQSEVDLVGKTSGNLSKTHSFVNVTDPRIRARALPYQPTWLTSSSDQARARTYLWIMVGNFVRNVGHDLICQL